MLAHYIDEYVYKQSQTCLYLCEHLLICFDLADR